MCLFCSELDNVAYAVGLGEQVRSRFENVGRFELQTREYQRLLRSKVAHVTFIVLFVLGGVWRAMYGPLSKTPPLHIVGNMLLVRALTQYNLCATTPSDYNHVMCTRDSRPLSAEIRLPVVA